MRRVAFLGVSLMAVVLMTGCVEKRKKEAPAPAPVSAETLAEARKHVLAQPPEIKHPMETPFGGGSLTFLGYSITPEEVAPGDKVTLTLYWKPNKEIGGGWRLFTHMTDAKGATKLNVDKSGIIRKGYQPGQWKPGEIIEDIQEVRIPKDWSSEFAEFRVGLWRGNERMPIQGPADRENRLTGIKVAVKAVPTSKLPLAQMDIPKAKHPIKVDGKLDPKEWDGAARVTAFFHPATGKLMEKPVTEARLQWDDKNLYVAFVNQDEDINSTYTKHDDALWNQDVDELFLDPDGDGKNYYELQVSPAGVTFDSYLPSYRKNQNEWESGMIAAVQVKGTLNKAEDVDQTWTAEMSIPFSVLKFAPSLPPKAGDVWRGNLFRIDLSKEGVFGLAWSPPMKPDYHVVERFGNMRFVETLEEVKPPEPQAKAAEPPAKAAEPQAKTTPQAAKPAADQAAPQTAKPPAKAPGAEVKKPGKESK